jgi:hypothetical protein
MFVVQRETEKSAVKQFDPQTAIFDPAKLTFGILSSTPKPVSFDMKTAFVQFG